MSAHQFPGRLLNPRVFSAYYTPFPKSRRFLTLINAFLRLRRKRHGTGKNFRIRNCVISRRVILIVILLVLACLGTSCPWATLRVLRRIESQVTPGMASRKLSVSLSTFNCRMQVEVATYPLVLPVPLRVCSKKQ